MRAWMRERALEMDSHQECIEDEFEDEGDDEFMFMFMLLLLLWKSILANFHNHQPSLTRTPTRFIRRKKKG